MKMNKNKAETVIKETIEYANKEIEKNKKRTRKGIVIAICSLAILVIAYLVIFKLEMPVKYADNLVTVNVPEDEGLDININLNNYKSAKGVLVKNCDNTYDLYIGITQTLYTKIAKSDEQLIRIGNGMIVDFNSGSLIEYMPGESVAENIMHVYFIDNLSNEVACMDDEELINYDKKTLVWTR
jgi:hypothetical protein